MEVSRIGDSILHFNYPTAASMHTAGNRFHVYYEDPIHKGRLETDNKVWSGYNYPPGVITQLPAEQLSPEETELQNWALHYPNNYIILTYQNPNVNRTIVHETAHALFSTDSNYREEVISVLKGRDLSAMKSILSKYDDEVFLDEAQAYLIEWSKVSKDLSDKADSYLLTHRELSHIYNRYAARLHRVPLQKES